MEREILKKAAAWLRKRACEVRLHSRSGWRSTPQTTQRPNPNFLDARYSTYLAADHTPGLNETSRIEKRKHGMTEVIKKIHEDHKGRLGIDRLVAELAKLGRQHSPRRVRRLARAAGLT